MRSRFGLTPSGGFRRNEILESVVRNEHQKDKIEEWKKKRRLREKQKFTYDTKPDEYNALEDDEIGGVMELGVLNQSGSNKGQVDTGLTGNIIIGGKQIALDKGKIRIVDKQAVDSAIVPILERRRYRDQILAVILADRSGQLARMILPKGRYDMLQGGAGVGEIDPKGLMPSDVKMADARPEFMSYYPEGSKQFALALHKLTFILDRTELAFSENIDGWLEKYTTGEAGRPASIGDVSGPSPRL
jgi:hypothetical protein